MNTTALETENLYPENDLIAWVDLSTLCNAACPQCHRTDRNGLGDIPWLPKIKWTLGEFKMAFPKESLHKFKRFEFCGTWGDPVMNKDMYAICEYIIRNSKAKIQINTNGSIRTPDWWWDLGVMCGDRLRVWFDVDGINQEMHEKYRQKTDLQKIQDNIESITATNAGISIMVIVFKHNQDYLEEIHDMVRSWGVTGEVSFMGSNRFYHQDTFEFIKDDKEEILEQSTLGEDHPMLNTTWNIPVRDHKWRKELDASGQVRKDFW